MESEEARISLEEKVAFLERESEQFRAELGEAWKALGALEKQFERFARSLESRNEESDLAE